MKTGSFKTGASLSLALSPAGAAELKSIAAVLKDFASQDAGVTMTEGAGGPQVVLELASNATLAKLGEEAYTLEVTPDAIKISAPTGHGVFNGAMTVVQLLAAAKHSGNVPCLAVTDYPRFAHRGVLIDPARNFLTMTTIKKTVDSLARLKMNVLHFHLVDDQGWRFESKIFPKLTQVGGAGGFYTQDQLRDLVAYAAARYVTVMPEIEMPGHSRALLASYPELTCSGQPLEVATHRGIFPTALCPGKPEVYDFLDKLTREVASIFPSYYIHTGSDEVAPKDWNNFPGNDELKKNLAEKNDKGLQCYFINKVNSGFLKMGRRMTVWDEMVDCLPEGARVQAWRSIGAARTAAMKNHDVVVSLVNPWYLDYPVYPGKLWQVYKFEPVPRDLPAEFQKHIVGGEGCLWGESAPDDQIISKLFPRLIAISEVLWSPKDQRNYWSFKARERTVYKTLQKQGVHFVLLFNIGPLP